jgi:uncharacterized repeat protein (TIGR03843 family)
VTPSGRGGGAGRPGPAELLATGEVELKGRIPWSSNATFLVEVTGAGGGPSAGALAIYKPARGERPLWDFGRGLWRREVASYQLARHLGWDMVPVTVARPDAPLGPGSVQLFVAASPEEHYFTLVEQEKYRDQLQRMAVFDVVANNADRKSGHCLVDGDDHIWGIDHGLTFHAEPKLRTVIWDFAGQKVDDGLLGALEALVTGGVPEDLGRLLDDDEVEATVARAGALLRRRKFPRPLGDFPYPWPLI